MKEMLYAATNSGVLVFECAETGWRQTASGLADQTVTSVVALNNLVFAGTRNGIYRSHNLGQDWESANDGLTTQHVRWLAHHSSNPVYWLAGTEPAGIFFSLNEGQSWSECEEVAALRDEHGWYLPYSPEAGAVRGFAFHGTRGYAAIEQGGVMMTDDGGKHWRMAEGSPGSTRIPNLEERRFIHPDVHSIESHSISIDLVTAPTGGGLFRTTDGGKTWAWLYRCYCRAVWVDPADPQHMIFGPADSVDRGGRIEETHDGGESWQPASEGLNTPWARHMVERFTQVGRHLLAVLSNGQVISKELAGGEWKEFQPDLHGVEALATAVLEVD